MKKIVLTYGTFDLLHKGHINILSKAKKLGDKLAVGLSTDEFNNKKGKTSHETFATRKQNLLGTGIVDLVFEECEGEQKRSDISKYKIAIFVMGSDGEGKFDDLVDIVEVRYFERTKGISSTMLRDKISKNKN